MTVTGEFDVKDDGTVSLPSGSSASFPLAAQYQFGGTYSKVELPVIECGGTIELSR